MESITIMSGLLLGLTGAGHCLAMCGGIISTLSMSSSDSGQPKWSYILAYQLGRITSYTLFGFAAGWIGLTMSEASPLPILKTLSGILLILMALYISRIWMALSYLEKLGKLFWNRISPFGKKLLPVKTTKQALFLGSLWGWLPCGLVYTSLGYALSLGSATSSALFMLTFGLGTLPATLLAGSASVTLKRFLNHKAVKNISALFFFGFGVFTLYSIYVMGGGGHHHH